MAGGVVCCTISWPRPLTSWNVDRLSGNAELSLLIASQLHIYHTDIRLVLISQQDSK